MGVSIGYTRFGYGGSHVYVFLTENGVECCECGLAPPRATRTFSTFSGALRHLVDHLEAGQTVPPFVFSRLAEDSITYSDDVHAFLEKLGVGGRGIAP